jgi:aminoglycoside phosphotransferase family enzyme/predicted kinase
MGNRNNTHPPLIEALLNPALYEPPAERIELIETHISWVILTGPYAYKIKKPVNLGFLDFSALEKRHFYCEEELRLNRRLAPEIYLEVIAIGGTPQLPVLGKEPAIEYAIRMRQFSQDALLDRVLARGELTPRHIDAIAREVARFHGRTAKAPAGSHFGNAQAVCAPVAENFRQIREHVAGGAALEALEAWSEKEYAARSADFETRKAAGFVRECHGDLHLGNMALLGGEIVLFDCIEFSENLRWIDVMSEIAFLAMDLEDRGQTGLARRFLGTYLEQTGDYAGLKVLRFYLVYRAMVRAKVACIRAAQAGMAQAERNKALAIYREYIELAGRFIRPAKPWLAITHGLSGSGKTTCAQAVVERLGAIRIRSDIERKRLFGLAPEARSGSGLDSGLYTPAAHANTYRRLEDLARMVAEAGYPAVVDAAFLKRAERDSFRNLAHSLGLPFAILDFQTNEVMLRERVALRQRASRDASEATLEVLERQIVSHEPLQADELAWSLGIAADRPSAPEQTATLVEEWAARQTA